jgi:hypothetical protein
MGQEPKALTEFTDNNLMTHLWLCKFTGDPLELQLDLQTLGFTETMVFPDLPNLAAELTRIEGWR